MQWLIYTGVIAIKKPSNMRNTKMCLIDSFLKKIYFMRKKTRDLGSWHKIIEISFEKNQGHTETC